MEYNLSMLLTGGVPLLEKLILHKIVRDLYLNTNETHYYTEVHVGFKMDPVMYSLCSNRSRSSCPAGTAGYPDRR